MSIRKFNSFLVFACLVLGTVVFFTNCKSDKKADSSNAEQSPTALTGVGSSSPVSVGKDGVSQANEVRISPQTMVPEPSSGKFTYTSIAKSMCACKERLDSLGMPKLKLMKEATKEGKEPDPKMVQEAMRYKEDFDRCMTDFTNTYNSIGHNAKEMTAAFKKTCPETGKAIGY